jgi:hypothetical protein
MSIYVHPDGYLQITEGHNIQDVSEGSIMWRMFRGWNQRRQAVGLDALAYIGTEFVPVTNLDDAKINVGANLQNYLFWQKLQKGLCEIIDRRFTVDAFFVATEAAFVPSPASGTYAGYRHSGVDVYDASFKMYDAQQMGISGFDLRLFAPFVYATPQSSPPFQSSPEWIADVGELIGGYVIIGSPLKVNIVNNLLRAYSSLRMMHYSFSGESKRGWGGHVSQYIGNNQYETCETTRSRAISNMTFTTNAYAFFYTAIDANAYRQLSQYVFWGNTVDTNGAGSCRLYMGAEINRRDFLIISSGFGTTRAVFENAYGVAEPFVLESRNVGNFSQDGTITVNHSDLHVDGRGGFESPIVLLNVNCNQLERRSCMFTCVYQVKYKFADTP